MCRPGNHKYPQQGIALFSGKRNGDVLLLEDLERAMRRLACQSAIFRRSLASGLGISMSDLECLDILHLEGRLAAGRLGQALGLTTGAVTGVVDRLERKGFVRRARDEGDRRKVIIEINPMTVTKVAVRSRGVCQTLLRDWINYPDQDLRLLLGFVTRCHEAVMAERGGRRVGADDDVACS
jgi:DNA-binding MarR family transcriptional regulator